MSRHRVARLPGFRAWTSGRRRLAVGQGLLAAAMLLLWLWRAPLLFPALFNGPWPLGLAAGTSLALLTLALVADRGIHAGTTAARRQPSPGLAAGLCGAYVALALLAPALLPMDPNLLGDGVATQNLPPGSTLHLLVRVDGAVVAANALEADGDQIRFRRGKVWTQVPRGELRGTRPEDWHQVRHHWLGTDHLGRDLLSRVLAATPVSLGIGLAAALLSMILGALVGGLTGIAGPRVDAFLMRMTDTFLAFPRLFLVLLVLAVIPGSLAAAVLVLALTGWMVPARLVRSRILTLRQAPFVQAAHAAGRGRIGVLVRHLLPHAAAPLLVAASLRIGETMLIEAGLSYLGMGVPAPHATWGNLIAGARPALGQAWWVAIFPGLMLTGAVLSFNVAADNLRSVLARR
jgi:peptide/nickel transport system permease protein